MHTPQQLLIGKTPFIWGSKTYVMGIINVTEDSFSGDGLINESSDLVFSACEQALRFVADGADILDVGGESTRPGATPVSEDAELERVIPVIEALKKIVSVPISIDTIKPAVARKALSAGATMLNTVADVRVTPELLTVAKECHVPIVITHNRSNEKELAIDPSLGGRYEGVAYADVVAEVTAYLKELAILAESMGIPKEHIIIDPGIGFGKTTEQNLELIRNLRTLTALGFPILVGPSRKSFIGYILDLPKEERLEGTIAASVLSAERGADIIRVHDVRANVRALRISDRVTRG